MSDQKAILWHQIETRDTGVPRELREPPATWFKLREAQREEIRRRVELVLCGEVRRSEMSPGDLAVYFGRYRMLETSPPAEFLAAVERREREVREVRRMVWWDCLGFDEKHLRPSTRLFGNANVGNLNLTNLQVAGSLCGDQTAWFSGWHLSTNASPDELPLLDGLLAESAITLVLGDRAVAQRRGDMLLNEPWPIGVLFPCRQNFSAVVEFFGKYWKETADKLIARRKEDSDREQLCLWVHLEGWHEREVY